MTCLPEATLLSHLVLFGVSHQCISKVAIQALLFVSYDHGLGLNRKWHGSSLYQLGKRADNYP